ASAASGGGVSLCSVPAVGEPGAEAGEIAAPDLVDADRDAKRRTASRQPRSTEDGGGTCVQPRANDRQSAPVEVVALLLHDAAGERARRDHVGREPQV